MHGNQLRRMTKGYKADAAKQGYGQRAAEPIFSAKIKALLEYLMAKQQDLAGCKTAANLRWIDYEHAMAVLLQRFQCERTEAEQFQDPNK